MRQVAALPAGWRWSSIGEIAAEGPVNGYSGPTGADAEGTQTLKLSATSSGSCVLTPETTKRLYESIAPESDLWLKPEDLLVQRSNTIDLVGTAAVFDGAENTFVYPDLMMRLRLKGEADSGYVWRYLNSDHGRSFFRQMAAGSSGSMPKVSGSKLRAMPIMLPPLPEQRRIAAILDQAEALRAKRRAALAKLDTLAQSIFIEMFGDPVANPKSWEDHLVLGDVAEIVSGVTIGRKLNGLSTRTIPYLAVVNVQDREIKLSPLKETEATDDEIARYLLRKNDLLLTEGGDPDKLGRGSLWHEEVPECIHQNHVFRVRLISPVIHPLFLNWLVGSRRGKNYFLKSAKQTTGIASINMTQLRGFPLLAPPMALQQQFAVKMAALEQLKAKHSMAAAHLDALFASLQHRAFRGEL